MNGNLPSVAKPSLAGSGAGSAAVAGALASEPSTALGWIRRWAGAILPWATIALFTGWFFAGLRFDPGWVSWDDGDALLHATLIKTVIESGWVFDNPRLGAPFGMTFLDFPGADGLLVLIIKLLSQFTSDPSVVLNLFYVSGFPLTFAAAYWVFRRVAVDVIWSTAGALIYTCLPYHFLRGQTHLYLSSYFSVPLLVWAALRIYPGEQAFDARSAHPAPWGWREFIVLIIGGSAGVYYAFFGIFLLLTAGSIGAAQVRSLGTLRRALVAAAVVTGAVFVNLSPYIAYRISSGPNPEVGKRLAIETETYGLRAAQMLLPMQGHQVPAVARFTDELQAVFPDTEAKTSALGIVASTGFLLLVGLALLGRWAGDLRIAVLARMNLALFCFSAIGGFATLFALLVTPQFRGMNRASVVIGFMSLLGLFLWVQQRPKWWQWPLQRRWWVRCALAATVVCAALYDQVPVGVHLQSPPMEKDGRVRRSATAAFVRDLEATVPAGAMIYVMPYVAFPEQPPAFEEGYNGLLRPYYYSHNTRWSYGAMRGRRADAWLRSVESMPLPARVAALQRSGFSGIYVDRKGFRDHGAALEAGLHAIVPGAPLESTDRECAFYRLQPDSHPQLTPAWGVRDGKGAFAREHDANASWFWSTRNSEMLLENFSSQPVPVRFTAQLMSLDGRRIRMKFADTTVLNVTLKPSNPLPITLELVLAPGMNTLSLESDRPGVRLSTDSRELAVMWANPTVSAR